MTSNASNGVVGKRKKNKGKPQQQQQLQQQLVNEETQPTAVQQINNNAPVATTKSYQAIDIDEPNVDSHEKDVEASRFAHDLKLHSPHTEQDEPHGGQAAEHIKSIVYGGLDGIITTFATVTSVAGAELSAAVIVVLGISHLFADGLSMGMGDAMSSQAEYDYNLAERKRESWECDNNLEGEIAEMLEIYSKKGIAEEDAKTIIHTLSKYRKPFLDHMMVEELGLMPTAEDESVYQPLIGGLVTMASFVIFGSVPLFPYLLALIPGLSFDPWWQLTWSIAATVAILFALGAIKGATVEYGKRWWWAGLLMAVNGSVAAALGYVIGWGMSKIVGSEAQLAATAG